MATLVSSLTCVVLLCLSYSASHRCATLKGKTNEGFRLVNDCFLLGHSVSITIFPSLWSLLLEHLPSTLSSGPSAHLFSLFGSAWRKNSYSETIFSLSVKFIAPGSHLEKKIFFLGRFCDFSGSVFAFGAKNIFFGTKVLIS